MFSGLCRRMGLFFLRLADKSEKEQIAKQVPETRIDGEPYAEPSPDVYATRGCLCLTDRPAEATVSGVSRGAVNVRDGKKNLPEQINFADGSNIVVNYKTSPTDQKEISEDLKRGVCQYCVDLDENGKKSCKVCEGTGFIPHEKNDVDNISQSVAASTQVEIIAQPAQPPEPPHFGTE